MIHAPFPSQTIRHSDLERRTDAFLAKASVTSWSGCWLWLGKVDKDGYGRFDYNKRAHRVSYALAHGEVSAGLTIDHLCGVPGCVNPVHLEQVTSRVNALRGGSPAALNARKSTCKRGHQLSGTNLHVGRDGRRVCRSCDAAAGRRERRLKAAAKRGLVASEVTTDGQ